MDHNASKVDKTFDRVVNQLNDYAKVFRAGGMLEKAIDEMGGDSAYLRDIRSQLDALSDTINDAHMYAMVNYDDVYGEATNVSESKVSKGKKLTEGVLDDNDEDGFMARSQLYFMARDAIKLHGMIGDRDNLEPWLAAKITKAAEAIEASREYIEYRSMAQPSDVHTISDAPIELPVETTVADSYDMEESIWEDYELDHIEEGADLDDGSRALDPQKIAASMMQAARAQAMKKVKK